MRKSLALFDLDGTLLKSNEFDADCYVEAVRQILGVDQVDTDWSHYHDVTDGGILAEIHRKNFHREISRARARSVRQAFVRILKKRLKAERIRLEPLAGAAEALRALRHSDRWTVALATGGWRESAELKLRNAGLPAGSLRIFSADDSVSRPEIIRIATGRMQIDRQTGKFTKVVYIGDGIWDVRAAREARVAFVGVGSKTARLRREGAGRVIRDYSDLTKFLKALETSSVPKTKKKQ